MPLYMNLIQCTGFPDIYAQKEKGVGSVSHGYMCILLYATLIWCSGFPEIYAQLEEGVGVSLPLVYGHLGSFSRGRPPHFLMGSTSLV